MKRSARAGTGEDDRQLRALHDAHASALSAYVVGLTGGDHARAQDVVQETLLRAWRTPAVLSQANGSVRGWLYTVARRIVIDEWRTPRSRYETVTETLPDAAAPADSPDSISQHAVDRQVVVAALRTLSPAHRDVVLECYFKGSSVAEAAQALGIPPGTVKSRLHYALRALRLALDEQGVHTS
jgi:RNA polymerase sigma-70 factor (ECF subfamily)